MDGYGIRELGGDGVLHELRTVATEPESRLVALEKAVELVDGRRLLVPCRECLQAVGRTGHREETGHEFEARHVQFGTPGVEGKPWLAAALVHDLGGAHPTALAAPIDDGQPSVENKTERHPVFPFRPGRLMPAPIASVKGQTNDRNQHMVRAINLLARIRPSNPLREGNGALPAGQ